MGNLINVICNILIGIIFSTMIVISFMNYSTIIEYEWVGIAICIGINFMNNKWSRDEIEKLNKEIKEMRKDYIDLCKDFKELKKSKNM